MQLAVTALLALTVGHLGAAQLPPELEGVGVTERVGAVVDLGLEFVDESGRIVRLGEYFRGRPVILNLVYYSCPMLCTLVLNGQLEALKQIPGQPGRDFEIVTISIDPTETAELARNKKQAYVGELGRGGEGWHFLVDRGGNVKLLAGQVGFHYRYDEQIRQYAHPAVIMVLTADGRLSRYLYGIEFKPLDLRLALAEAWRGRFRASVDQLLLFCYHYDPGARSYVLLARRLMSAGGLATVAILGAVLIRLWNRERKTAAPVGGQL